MDEIKHSHPTGERDDKGTLFREGSSHVKTFEKDGKEVGTAIFRYYGRPIKFFYVSDLNVNFEEREKGYGRMLMESVQAFLKEKKCAGILQNGIGSGAPERLRTMYERSGWETLSAPHRQWYEKWLGFNLPADIDETTIARMIDRTDV